MNLCNDLILLYTPTSDTHFKTSVKKKGIKISKIYLIRELAILGSHWILRFRKLLVNYKIKTKVRELAKREMNAKIPAPTNKTTQEITLKNIVGTISHGFYKRKADVSAFCYTGAGIHNVLKSARVLKN